MIAKSISNFPQFIDESVAEYNGQFQYCLLDPLPKAQEQKGQTCKLNALSVVLNWLHETYDMPKPLPVHKTKIFSNSLRKIAKQHHASQVGEVYNPQVLAAIAGANGYGHTQMIEAKNPREYMEMIISLIKNKQAPIVFFDAMMAQTKKGESTFAKSKWEHAAVVVGYFIQKNNQKLGFFLAQWGEYYWLDAYQLAASAGQLASSRLPEWFYKYEGKWYEHNALSMQKMRFAFFPTKIRQAIMPSDGGFRNKIFVVARPSLACLMDQESDHLFDFFCNRIKKMY